MSEYHLASNKYEGKPCVKCTKTLRYTKNKKCVECRVASAQSWVKANPERKRKNTQNWYRVNLEQQREYNKQRNKDPKIKRSKKNSDLKRKYGITTQDFDKLWFLQKGLCAICNIPMLMYGKENDSVCIDHNHTTGKIRGLLCSQHNRAIGLLQDNTTYLRNAIAYLETVE
jgi:hypothetical protein